MGQKPLCLPCRHFGVLYYCSIMQPTPELIYQLHFTEGKLKGSKRCRALFQAMYHYRSREACRPGENGHGHCSSGSEEFSLPPTSRLRPFTVPAWPTCSWLEIWALGRSVGPSVPQNRVYPETANSTNFQTSRHQEIRNIKIHTA